MKTILVALLSIALLLIGLSPCQGQSQSDLPPVNPDVASVIEAVLADNGQTRSLYPRLGDELRMLGEDARREAARKLLEVLTDEDTSLELARGVLVVIGSLGEPGLVIESELVDFRKRRPDLKLSTECILNRMGSSQCGRIYAERLAKEPGRALLDAIATRGRQARDAGPEVVKLLNHSNWDMRLAAARTLGAIGYREAVPALIDLLDEPTDVRLNQTAAESLGRLGAPSAVEALKETAASHWYPVVRDTAREAMEHIVAGEPYRPEPRERRSFEDWDPFWLRKPIWNRDLLPKDPDQLRQELELSPVKTPNFVEEPLEAKMYKATSRAKMEELTCEGKVISGDENTVESQPLFKHTPDVALRVTNGWLAGRNWYRYGGRLVFVADNGERTEILRDNVNDLFKLGERYIAVSGLSNHSTNPGLVYEVKSTDDGRWVCKRWRALPGAPRVCGKLPSGDVFISTEGGGDLVLAPDGSFRMASN